MDCTLQKIEIIYVSFSCFGVLILTFKWFFTRVYTRFGWLLTHLTYLCPYGLEAKSSSVRRTRSRSSPWPFRQTMLEMAWANSHWPRKRWLKKLWISFFLLWFSSWSSSCDNAASDVLLHSILSMHHPMRRFQKLSHTTRKRILSSDQLLGSMDGDILNVTCHKHPRTLTSTLDQSTTGFYAVADESAAPLQIAVSSKASKQHEPWSQIFEKILTRNRRLRSLGVRDNGILFAPCVM